MHKFENFTDLFTEQSKKNPQTAAIYLDKTSISYRQLDFFIWKLTTFLYKNGIRSGDVVSLTFNAEFTLLITMLAVARIGATVFILPKNTPHKLSAKMLKNVNATIQLTDTDHFTKTMLPFLLIDIKSLIRDPSSINVQARSKCPKTYWIIVTGSGTTGKSKMIPITHKQQISRISLNGDWYSKTSPDRFASLMHLNHYTAVARSLGIFYFGGTVVIDRSVHAIDLVKKYNVTILLATVFHVKRIMSEFPKNHKRLMPKLNGLLITGSPVSNALRREIHDRICSKLFVFYGINECGIVSVAKQPNLYQVSGTVGLPTEESKIDIVNSDSKVLPVGETGEIRIKTEGMIDHYLNDEDATKRAFIDGWFYPGDLGKLTLDGQLIHLGRSDDMMIMAGNNVYPAEIEQCIISHPNVKDAVAMPIKGDLAQEVPVCAVILETSGTTTEKELLTYTYQHLGVRAPKRVAIIASLDRNEQGKLHKASLVKKIQTYLQTHKRL